MAKLVKYQGEDIAFSIKIFSDKSKTELINLDNVAEIIAIIYTGGNKVAKFSKTDKVSDGYNRLTKVTSTEYSSILESVDTIKMQPGTLSIEIKISEINADLTDGKYDVIQSAVLGELKKSNVKNY